MQAEGGLDALCEFLDCIGTGKLSGRGAVPKYKQGRDLLDVQGVGHVRLLVHVDAGNVEEGTRSVIELANPFLNGPTWAAARVPQLNEHESFRTAYGRLAFGGQ